MIDLSDFENNKEFWRKEVVRGSLVYPNTEIIRFVKKYLERGSTILDFGCGAGRDSIALANEGYQVIAMDYNKDGLEIIKKKSNFDIKTIVNKGISVPIEKDSVDGIIADGSLFYNNKENTIQLLKNLFNVLKKGGYIWADWRTKEDSLYGRGDEIEEGFFRLNGESDRPGSMYHFFHKSQLEEIYKIAGYNIISIDDYKYTQNNGESLCAWYHVVGKK